MYSVENQRTNIMKRTILFITSLVLMTSVSFSQSKVNTNTLVQYGDKMYKINDDKPYTGKVFDLHKSNGNKKMEGYYKDGLRNRKWNWWHENGQKEKEGTFKDGEEISWIGWTYYENGQKSQEETYKDGKEDGLFTQWHQNGQKKQELIYKDGKADGLVTVWHENGQKSLEGTYKDGEIISLKCWDEDGNEKECN